MTRMFPSFSFPLPVAQLCLWSLLLLGDLGAAHAKKSSLRQALSPCNRVTDPTACASTLDSDGSSCQWCVAGAIPSECVSNEQAKMLPSGVFECSAPQRHSTEHTKTPLIVGSKTYQVNAQENEGDFCDPDSKSISGYMDIQGSKYDEDGENKHYFFWMFEKRGGNATADTPFIIWLTGGPGCSSILALLTENGPCSVNKDGASTSVNPYAWTETAHMLWLDQPAGVGFSYGSETDVNEDMVSEDAYYFLQAFFQTYPEYASNPLYIVGESYGGHYAPAIAHRVWTGNQIKAENTTYLNLAGLGVGNGLTNPEEQYKWYPEMGYNNSHGIQVFSKQVYDGMQQVVPTCTQLIHKCNEGDGFLDEFACQSAFLVCNMGLTSPYQSTGLNPYDIRKDCGSHPLCYDFSHIEKWLNMPSTKEHLHVDPQHSHSWSTCNFGINMKFHSDWVHDFSPQVADLLNAGIPVLIYAGDVDFICNYLGNQAWTYQLEWSGREGFQAAEPHEWKGAGLARSYGDFTFLQVYDAGHMVPTDQPEVSLDMIRNFVHGGSW